MDMQTFVNNFNSKKEVSLPGFLLNDDNSPSVETIIVAHLTALLCAELVKDDFEIPQSREDGTFSDDDVNALKNYFKKLVKRGDVADFIIQTIASDGMLMQAINMALIIAKQGTDELLRQAKDQGINIVSFVKTDASDIREMIKKKYSDNPQVEIMLMLSELASMTKQIGETVQVEKPKYLN